MALKVEVLRHLPARSESWLVLVLLACLLLVLQRLTSRLSRARKATGIPNEKALVSVDGSDAQPVKEYISVTQNLAGRPDAVVKENGALIPIEIKPLAKKMRERHVAQLLVYMRLIEEFEGIKPPYGYLVLGTQGRRVRIENSSERQEWLTGVLDNMRAVLAGMDAKASPHPKKCANCDVRERCRFRADKPS